MTIKITVARSPITAEFDVGSIGEAIAILSESKDKFTELLGLADTMSGADEQEGAPVSLQLVPRYGADDGQSGSAVTEAAPRKPRKPKIEAVAPAPLPVPQAPAPAPAAADPLDIPEALRRSAPPVAPPAPPAAAAPPPPLLPAAPSVAPALPPTSPLAAPIVADLDKRRKASVNDGKDLADWLAGAGLIAKGASYDEAVAVVPFTTHEKLEPIAKALGLA